jgi:PAS domain S-box-containing protein
MSLSWITIVWSGAAAACLTIALMHLSIWLRQPGQRAHLVFVVLAVSAAVIAALELLMMGAQTPEQFGAILRWKHVPLAVLVISSVVYVRLYFGVGNRWLAAGACALRLLAMVINFRVEPNINFAQITGLQRLEMPGGEFVSVAVGTPGPWVWVGQLSTFLLLLFVVDASIALWRRGGRAERRRAVIVGGSFALFVAIAAGVAQLLNAGIIQIPSIVSMSILAIVMAAGYELSSDVARAARFSQQLHASEAELRRNKQRIDRAQAAAQTGIWEWDIGRDEIWITDQGRELFGFAPAERIDLNRILDVLHPEDREGVGQAVTRTVQDGGGFEREYRIVVVGETRWVATCGNVEIDAGGKSVRMRGVSHNISRRKQIEAELRESEARFRDMANSAPVMIWMAGTDKLCTFFNQGWLAFTGRTLAQELGNGWADGVHPVDFDLCLKTYSSAFDSRQSFTMEYRRRNQAGEYRWILDVGAPRLAADGKFLGYIGSCTDITERKRSDDLLKKERAFLRQVIDIDPNLIFAKNREGRFTLVNKAVAEVFGTTVENIVGKTDADFNSNAAEIEHFRRVDLEVMDTLQERFVAEESITDARAKTHWLQTVKRPIVDADGRANQVLGAATDITRRKEAEIELARQRSELARLSRVSALGQLSASIAHELNQPLAAMLGNAEAALMLLGREPVDLAELRDICTDIVREDKRAAEIIRRLRDFYRRGEIMLEPLDVNAEVRATIDLVSNELLTRHVTALAELAPSPPQINAGRVQFQQVLLNLILNAADAMSGNVEEERVVTIRTAQDGAHIRVSVVDRGPGIPDQDLNNVFEAFWSTKAGGMGIGLAICKSIVVAHGGALTVANNSGGGAIFSATFPVRAVS